AGDVIEVEKIVGPDETLTFTPLLVVDDKGKAHAGAAASKATVTAKPVGETKGDKIHVVKYRPKTGYAKKTGHRQQYTLIEISDVSLG
ncbi:MAG: 50S ribosomal protein L21, partial [Actinomycetota bacterium]|nr:50S ribosomal protein L21 [Actinomycetota bacterium]